jgi:hypothetical protein
LPGRKEKNNPHPYNYRTPTVYSLHLSSIAFLFCHTRAKDKIPSPNPTNDRKMITGVYGRLCGIAAGEAGGSVAPNTTGVADVVAGMTDVAVVVGLPVGVGTLVGVGVAAAVGVGIAVGLEVGVGVAELAGVGVDVGITTEICIVGVTLEYEHPAANL